jgi:hypothetical protein
MTPEIKDSPRAYLLKQLFRHREDLSIDNPKHIQQVVTELSDATEHWAIKLGKSPKLEQPKQ